PKARGQDADPHAQRWPRPHRRVVLVPDVRAMMLMVILDPSPTRGTRPTWQDAERILAANAPYCPSSQPRPIPGSPEVPMRLPRSTTRRLMALVAVVAVAL